MSTAAASTAGGFLCNEPNSPCINGTGSILSPLDEEEELLMESAGDDQETIAMANMFHELFHGSQIQHGSAAVVDSSLLQVCRRLKAQFQTCKFPESQSRQERNEPHADSVDLSLISESRKFVVDLANSNGLTSVARADKAKLSTEDLAALNKLHSHLIPASYRASRDMSQLIDSSWWTG